MSKSPISDEALDKLLGDAAPKKPRSEKNRRRQIWVSKEVWDHIAKHSRPLVDSADSTLRRLFGLPPKDGTQEEDT